MNQNNKIMIDTKINNILKILKDIDSVTRSVATISVEAYSSLTDIRFQCFSIEEINGLNPIIDARVLDITKKLSIQSLELTRIIKEFEQSKK